MNIDYKLIGSRIKEARKRKGITQEMLAESLDVTIGYVSQVERGITKISLDLLARVSTIFELDITYFLTNTCVKQDDYMVYEIMRELRMIGDRDRRIIYSLIEMMKKNQE